MADRPFKAGTPHDVPKKAHLTREQDDAYHAIAVETPAGLAAPAEYANTMLTPTGEFVKITDDTMSEGIRRAIEGHLVEITPESLGKAQTLAFRLPEVVDHLQQNRFLFAVDEDGVPVVYFHCDVPGNPDLAPTSEVPA